MNEEHFQMPLNLGEIQQNCTDQLRDLIEYLNLLYHATAAFESTEIAPLPTNTLPVVIQREPPLTLAQTKNGAQQWLFKKAVEDLIFGIRESAIAAYKYLTLLEMVRKEEPFMVKDTAELAEKMHAQMESAAKWADGESLGTILERIEKISGTPVFLAEEILSVNNFRNCLVHRNGVVGPKDLKNGATELILSYRDLVFYHQVGDVQKEMTWEDKIKQNITTGLGYRDIGRIQRFSLGEHVATNQHVFNALVYTGIRFVTQLLSLAMQAMSAPRRQV